MSALQDLPPAGGFGRINWQRNPCKKYFNVPGAIAGYLALTIGGYYILHLTKKEIRAERTERQSASNAVMPFILAENDRLLLKQVRKNRDVEEELMKNVPGWTVGTYYGRQRYMTLPEGQWIEPGFYEYYAHCDVDEMFKKQDMAHYT